MGTGFRQVAQESGGAPPSPGLAEAKSRPSTNSLLRYAPALVLFAIVIADAMRVADTDLWGHIFFGRIILTHHQLWFHAPGSYAVSAGRRTWIKLDWLADVAIALTYGRAGVVGLKLAKFTSVAALMTLLAIGEGESGASLKIQALVLFASAMAFVPQMQFRPVLATFVFFSATMAMLARDSYGRDAPLWLAVPMFALWANLHGGFFVGLVAMGLYTAICGLQDLAQGKGLARAMRLAALTSAATLATLLNPYGLHDWLTIIAYLRNPFTLRYISEFRPLLVVLANFYRHSRPTFPFICAILIMGAMLVTFALSPRADDLALFAIAVLMSGAALYAVRNTALAVIAAVVPLCRHLDLVIARMSRPPPEALPADAQSSMWTRPVWQIALAALAIALALNTELLSKQMPAGEAKPVGALAFMHVHNLHGNVLCKFGWADYLLWHDAPRSKIFIESIFEAYYPHSVQTAYAAVNYAQPGAARVLDEYPNDFVLMPTGSPAYTMMTKQPRWRLVYRDPVAALFARAGSRAAHIPGIPIIHATAPPSFFP